MATSSIRSIVFRSSSLYVWRVKLVLQVGHAVTNTPALTSRARIYHGVTGFDHQFQVVAASPPPRRSSGHPGG